MNRGAWQVTVHGVAKSQTRLSNCYSLTISYVLYMVCCSLPVDVNSEAFKSTCFFITVTSFHMKYIILYVEMFILNLYHSL